MDIGVVGIGRSGDCSVRIERYVVAGMQFEYVITARVGSFDSVRATTLKGVDGAARKIRNKVRYTDHLEFLSCREAAGLHHLELALREAVKDAKRSKKLGVAYR